MKNLKIPTELQKQGYRGIKVSSILGALTTNSIKCHMLLQHFRYNNKKNYDQSKETFDVVTFKNK